MQEFKFFGIAIFIGFFTLTFIFSCNNKSEKSEKKTINIIQKNAVPEIKFDTLFYDFGNLVEGEKVSCNFTYKNTGTSDLIILDAFSTCGCTVPSFSKEPLKPGDEGKIEVFFDSSGRKGVQYKNITLKLNTPMGEKTLTIKANVKSNISIN